ncbi:MAG TPA: hypothetical protein VEN81_10250 [Planctomycetota bacterium]|nr:hypothetical protein [Planctomycetota bacterium]
MNRLPPGRASEEHPLSSATLSLLSLAFLELKKDVTQLLDADWPEPVRRRAQELSTALWEASSRQALTALARVSRALVGLTRLSHGQAAPLKKALREKFGELLGKASELLGHLSKRQIG